MLLDGGQQQFLPLSDRFALFEQPVVPLHDQLADFASQPIVVRNRHRKFYVRRRGRRHAAALREVVQPLVEMVLNIAIGKQACRTSCPPIRANVAKANHPVQRIRGPASEVI